MVKLMGSCHSPAAEESRAEGRAAGNLVIALAGNANVGKSVVFNQLTGSNQIIGNWPGKTVQKAEGKLRFEGRDIRIVDLPGIYSFSTYSPEEAVARQYIATEKPDVVVNVVDACVLERNLFFTLQLMEMEAPLVVCLNQMDMAKKKGITIDTGKLEAALGVPVVPTVAVQGRGLPELMRAAVRVARQDQHRKRDPIRYGVEVEDRVGRLAQSIRTSGLEFPYPARWVAIKLLENDSAVVQTVGEKSRELVQLSRVLAAEIETIHREPCYAVIAAERYTLANSIANTSQHIHVGGLSVPERLDRIATHKVYGYVTAAVVIAGLLIWTFLVGNGLSTLLSHALSFFRPVDPVVSGPLESILWNGVFGGLVAGVTLVIPFVIPFYSLLAVMEDSGILTRVAFMMDSAMHQIGLHGKAIIPLILGYGCNVPAIVGTRIMETRRERLLAGLAITFAPCAARTIIILGLVAVFVGTGWALGLYALDLLVMFIVAQIALRVVPGEMTGLIMEMNSFRTPSLSVLVKQTWTRTKSIIYMVFPMYMIGTAAVQVLYVAGILEPINHGLSFLTQGWLGLPAIAGILLVFGIVRKELILLTLVAIYGTNLGAVLAPAQFIVLALVGMLYLPCISVIGVLAKEFGWKAAVAISATNLGAALLAGGIVYRLLSLVI